MTDVRTLSGRNHAINIYESMIVAYWKTETPDSPGYHLKNVHSEFLCLAECLGYRVEKIAAPEAAE